jgi:hypothetical protein
LTAERALSQRDQLDIGRLGEPGFLTLEVFERLAGVRPGCPEPECRPGGQQRPCRAVVLGESPVRRLVRAQKAGRSRRDGDHGGERCEPQIHTTSAFSRRA